MNTYTSLQAAIALKGIGFREPVISYYRVKGNLCANPEILYYSFSPSDWNYGPWYSVPNHLQGADYLAEKHEMFIVFASYATQLQVFKGEELIDTFSFESKDHRDRAIIEACRIIKERE